MRKEIERFIAVWCWRSFARFFFQSFRFVIVNWFDKSDIFNQQSDIISVESTLKGMYFLLIEMELINGKSIRDVTVLPSQVNICDYAFGQWKNKSWNSWFFPRYKSQTSQTVWNVNSQMYVGKCINKSTFHPLSVTRWLRACVRKCSLSILTSKFILISQSLSLTSVWFAWMEIELSQ